MPQSSSYCLQKEPHSSHIQNILTETYFIIVLHLFPEIFQTKYSNTIFTYPGSGEKYGPSLNLTPTGSIFQDKIINTSGRPQLEGLWATFKPTCGISPSVIVEFLLICGNFDACYQKICAEHHEALF